MLTIDRKFGAFYSLGKMQPSAEFVFAFGAWDHPPPFACLPDDTHVVLVNFAFVSAGDARTLTDHRRPQQLMLATEGLHPSIYILVPYGEELEGRRLNCHAVPTTLMKSDPARNKMNNTVYNSDMGWKAINTRNCMPINLAPGYHVEGFLAGEHTLVKVFKRLYQKLAGTADAECEPVLDIAGAADLDPACLVTSKGQALKEMVGPILRRRARGKLGRGKPGTTEENAEETDQDEVDSDNDWDNDDDAYSDDDF